MTPNQLTALCVPPRTHSSIIGAIRRGTLAATKREGRWHIKYADAKAWIAQRANERRGNPNWSKTKP